MKTDPSKRWQFELNCVDIFLLVNNGGGVKVRESRICPSREEAEAAILNRARNRDLEFWRK